MAIVVQVDLMVLEDSWNELGGHEKDESEDQ
jgi:hypothetical protein